ncbi:hypothetical protein HYR54_14295 [Candidatus Acetothermia bacterium]|nr:hypothetical protein [Candidatus Acetothermia bacterium]
MKCLHGVWRIGLAVFALSLLVAWSMGSNNGNNPTVQAQGNLETKLTLTMGEFFFQAEGAAKNAPIKLQTAVPYRMKFKNVGKIVHRIKIGRGLQVEEGVPHDYAEHLFDGVEVRIEGKLASGNFKVDTQRLTQLELEAGAELDVIFTLPISKKGEWELGCFVVNHYEAGMSNKLIVE